eukprot:4180607-Alexandrium_andersonii.AAC.1
MLQSTSAWLRGTSVTPVRRIAAAAQPPPAGLSHCLTMLLHSTSARLTWQLTLQGTVARSVVD